MKRFLRIILPLLVGSTAVGQTVVSSAGQRASNSAYQMDFVVGQMFYRPADGSGSLAPGTLQPTLSMPTAISKDIDVYLNANGLASITASQVDDGSSHPLGPVSLSLDKSNFSCSDVGVNRVVLQVTYGNSVSSFDTATVMVYDTIKPQVLIQNITVQLNTNGRATIAAADIDNGSNDACGIDSLFLDQASFDCSHIGENTVTLTAIDAQGNSSLASAKVYVVNNNAAALAANNITLNLDASGQASLNVSDVNNSQTGACGFDSLYLDKYNYSCTDVGINSATLTGKTTKNPLLDGADVYLKYPNAATYVGTHFNAAYGGHTKTLFRIEKQNQGNLELHHLDTVKLWSYTKNLYLVGSKQVITRMLKWTSANPVSSQFILLKDDLSNSTKINYDDGFKLHFRYDDNGDGILEDWYYKSSGVYAYAYTTSNIAQANSLSCEGQQPSMQTANFTVTVEDTVAPVALAQNVTVQLDANGQASITESDIDNGSNDACGIAGLSLDNYNFSCADVGANTVTLTVTDNNGNVSSATATVTVEDNVAPVTLTQNITVQLDANGQASITESDIDNGSNDNCTIRGLQLSKSRFDCQDLGTNSIVLAATDSSGNTATAGVIVEVRDTLNPVAVSKNITLYLDANGQVSAMAAMADSASSDNCGIDSLALSQVSFTCVHLGENPIVFTVWDADGNSAMDSMVVTIRDTMAPKALTQNFTVPLNAQGNATITPVMLGGGFTDNCSIRTMAIDDSTFSCSDLGLNTVNFTVRDKSGNSSSRAVTVSIVDTIAPQVMGQDITVYLNAQGIVSISPQMVDTGSTDNCSVQQLSLSDSTFNCNHLGLNSVTFTATDQSSNQSHQIVSITILDTIAPSVLTQNHTVYLDANGQASISPADVDNGSNDACDASPALSVDKSSFSCTDLGANTVRLTATDNEGNQRSATTTVTVMDTITPVAKTKNLTVYLDANGQAAIANAAPDNGSSDNCGIAYSLSQNTFGCSDEGLNIETMTVTDSAGNSASATFLIDVLDTTRPNLIVKPITVQLGATGRVSIAASQLDSNSTDNCTNQLFFSASKTSFSCADLGSNTVTVSATDVNNNTSTTTTTVVVEDNVLPIARSKNITVQLNANGQASILPTALDNGSTDNCTIAGLALSDSNFTCADIGQNSVTLTVTDQSGNSNVSNAIVTVVDNRAPTAVAQNFTVSLDANGQAGISTANIDNGSSDNCAVSSMSLDQSSFTCADLGANTVTLTVNDASGNSSTATATVTVEDNMAPNAVAQNFTVSLDANGQASITTADIDNGSSDNCGVSSMSLNKSSFTCADLGANTVTLTVNDASGNSNTATATVTVEDNTVPTVTTQNTTVYLDANGSATVTTADVNNGSSDNCGIANFTLSQSTFGCGEKGPNTIFLTATDSSGNSKSETTIVTVLDTMSPVVNAQNTTIYLDAAGSAQLNPNSVNNGSTDNCGIAAINLSQFNFGCSDEGTNTVTITMADSSNNQSSTQVTVTVLDTISPQAITQNTIVTLDANGQGSITAGDINNNSTDACGIASVTLDSTSFSCSDVGANTVVMTVTDVNGNSSTASATVTVQDNRAPTVNTQSTTVYLDATGQASITSADVNNSSTDNCSIASFSLSNANFGCSDLGNNTVQLTATDVNGNSASAGATVTVLDTIDPSIANLPANITAYSTANACDVGVTWPSITANDNCSGATITTSKGNGSVFSEGVTTVTVTATDGSGNNITRSFNVTVIDTISPIISGLPSTFNVSGNASSCDAVVNWTAPSATDNCGIASFTSSHNPGATLPVGSTTVTYTATDVNGNSRSASFTVRVRDQVAPTISNVPTNITANVDPGSCNAVVTYTMPGVSDNCSGATISSNNPSGSTFPIGNTAVTFTATDTAGNTSTASFTVTVVDNEAPVVTGGPSNDTIGQCNQVYNYNLPTATDNCSGAVTITQNAGLPSGSVFPPGATTNQFVIRDAAGNISTYSFTVVVIPFGQPNLPGLVEICEEANPVNITAGQNIVWTGNGITNNGTTFNPRIAGAGRHQLSYTFTDSMSCTVTGSILVSVAPQPVKPIIQRVASTTLQTGVYLSYQWYRDGVAIPGANSQTYSYTQQGNYQVLVSNSSGCSNFSEGFVVGSVGGGIGLIELRLQDLEVYPNPTHGKVTIDLGMEVEEELQVQVYSTSGKKVYDQKHRTMYSGKLNIDLGELAEATYFMVISEGEKQAIRKILMH